MVLSLDRWVGKVAIVTGASAGIGAAIAEALAEAGLKVVGLARRKERIEEISARLKTKTGKLYALKTDMTKEQDIIEAFAWVTKNVGPVHILINNAGTCLNTNLIDGDTEKWKQVLDLNVMGLCIATREAVKNMRENEVAGHIVHMNSIAGHTALNLPNLNIYPASKFAVTALTETLRNELNSIGSKIKITSISPGTVKTEIQAIAGLDTHQTDWPKLSVEDIADATIYVLSTPPHVQVHELIIKPVGEPI